MKQASVLALKWGMDGAMKLAKPGCTTRWLVVREKTVNICTDFGNSYNDNCEDDNTTLGLATSWQFWGWQFIVIPITRSYRHIFVSYFCFVYFLPLHNICSQSHIMYPLSVTWSHDPAPYNNSQSELSAEGAKQNIENTPKCTPLNTILLHDPAW